MDMLVDVCMEGKLVKAGKPVWPRRVKWKGCIKVAPSVALVKRDHYYKRLLLSLNSENQTRSDV